MRTDTGLYSFQAQDVLSSEKAAYSFQIYWNNQEKSANRTSILTSIKNESSSDPETHRFALEMNRVRCRSSMNGTMNSAAPPLKAHLGVNLGDSVDR